MPKPGNTSAIAVLAGACALTTGMISFNVAGSRLPWVLLTATLVLLGWKSQVAWLLAQKSEQSRFAAVVRKVVAYCIEHLQKPRIIGAAWAVAIVLMFIWGRWSRWW